MSKAEDKEVDKTEYITIGKYFHEFLENKECRVILFTPYGTMYAANPKTKKPARISVGLPSEICGNNLKDLDKWALTIVAIPRAVLETEKEKEKKRDEKNNVKSRKQKNK
ncbi:MAG TPA: hypothetical protein VMV43_10670 [Candidatus Nanopelagicaceae bacterium]|nr:hypothetical protein [Candidatus Nanopelagicaceae bacterium]